METIINEAPPKAYIARFHSGDFEPAYVAGQHDRLARTLNSDFQAPSWNAPFANGWFGPLYGVADIGVSHGVPSQFVRNTAGAPARALSPENASMATLSGYGVN